jgi:glycine dehydrogenase
MTGKRLRLTELQSGANFIPRHIGPRQHEIDEMLEVVGASSLDDLIDKVVPKAIRQARPLDLPESLSERNTLSDLRQMAGRNQVFTSMIGMGYYGCVTPKVILRNVLENPGWYTAYTPYQAEVSQGRLEALLIFQQMVSDLTGLPLANASLLDEATAAAEAMAMAKRMAKNKRTPSSSTATPIPRRWPSSRPGRGPSGSRSSSATPKPTSKPPRCSALCCPTRDRAARCAIFAASSSNCTEAGALAIVASDLLALALLTSPGELGADVAVGSAQRFGVPMGYGGPHAAFFATKEDYRRAIPGRIIGVSIDSHGHRALRMALQTREQHIRREKATSNICTAQVLLAVIAALFAVYHGPDGVGKIARRAHRWAEICARVISDCGYEVVTAAFFDTITVRATGRAQAIAARAREQRINLRIVDADHLAISFDETTRRSEVERLLACFKTTALKGVTLDQVDELLDDTIPEPLRRTKPFLTHPVFSLYHSETEMLRFLRRLQAKDIALDRSMIPLGSCTMKLNATTEMIPITWRQFAQMHPFAPLEQAQGYQQLFEELEQMLAEITGFDAVSLQPNAGSQGEYTGLLTIRRYHEDRGEAHRDICLIPVSAHGTNPASAVMAGLKVVIVACDEAGNVDLGDLEAKARQHSERLAALMITYPSTHGVFEENVREICQAVHDHGGQVYLDGANLNALVGLVRPAEIGADVCHINLHKTFCIPHGGGGPGMGPIGVKAHLAPYLPGHSVVEGVNPAARDGSTIGQVSATPWGSASILPISWAYIRMMGPDGLRRASAVAILSANYVARRLAPHFPTVYAGPGGYVAHECILDLRALRENSHITVEDVAKRLVDYGFHAPTMSWPVPETLMVEPTESESKRELDRFCDALIAIRGEIAEVESGKADRDHNVLKHAPHTHHLLMSDWTRPYPRETAFFPLKVVREDKYWPPVGRVDNAYGDRHLVCVCPPLEDYQEAAE